MTQLVGFRPFIHLLKPSLTTSIPPTLTVTLPQFSTKTPATRLRDRSPVNEAQPTGFTSPTVGGEEFIHIRDLNMESLSDSMVRIDQPSEIDTVAPAAAAPPALETSVGLDRHPVALPEELSRNVIHLSCESTAEGGVCDVYLVGTIHDTEESRRRVRGIVNFLKPEAVFLELCSSQLDLLTEQEKKVKISGEVEIFTVSEFGVAYEEAIKYGGKMILGDRPQEITSKRWSNTPFWRKKILLYASVFQTFFSASFDDLKMWKEMDVREMQVLLIQKMSKRSPTLFEALVDERDQYMSSTLLKVASESRSVVAVVGKGHLQGIKRNWKQPVVLEDLMTVPSVSYGYEPEDLPTIPSILASGLAIAGVFIISTLYLSCKK